jgi:hypothetical protein
MYIKIFMTIKMIKTVARETAPRFPVVLNPTIQPKLTAIYMKVKKEGLK